MGWFGAASFFLLVNKYNFLITKLFLQKLFCILVFFYSHHGNWKTSSHKDVNSKPNNRKANIYQMSRLCLQGLWSYFHFIEKENESSGSWFMSHRFIDLELISGKGGLPSQVVLTLESSLFLMGVGGWACGHSAPAYPIGPLLGRIRVGPKTPTVLWEQWKHVRPWRGIGTG